MTLRLLDLYSGAGGCAMGYHRGGFEVVLGVDLVAQPRYPFPFRQGDALEVLRDLDPDTFDVIHASPPCQAYSVATGAQARAGHADLYDVTREALEASGKPWVIENVPGAPSLSGVSLCGSMFGLSANSGREWLRRHRTFESSLLLFAPGPCRHRRDVRACSIAGDAYPRETGDRARPAERQARGELVRGREPSWADAQELMQVDWMSKRELTQAIPPAYTQWIAEQLGPQVERLRAA